MQTAQPADNKRKRSEADAEAEEEKGQPLAAAAAAASSSSSEPGADDASKKTTTKHKKKKKRVSPSSVPPAVGVLLPLLRRDCATQFHLTHFLDFEDLSSLFGSCRTWRDWLRSPSSNLLDSVRGAAGNQRGLQVDCCGQLQRLASSWLRPYVANLRASAGDEDTGVRWLQESRKQCATHHALFDTLTLFPRLRSLALVIDAPIDPLQLQKCFQALSDRLTHLSVTFSSDATHGESCRMEPGVLQVVHELHALQSLTFEGSNFYDSFAPLSFENLPRLPQLHTLKMKIMEVEPREDDEEDEGVYYNDLPLREARCSLEQAACLARCPALTYLQCGSWSTPPLHLDPDAGRTPDSKLAIAKLVAGKVGGGQQQQTQSSVAAAASSSSSSSLPPAALTYLDLGSTVMSGPLWRQIRQLTALTKLCPYFWRAPSGLSAGDWVPLGRFKGLRHFSLEFGRPWGSKQPGEGPRPPPAWAEDEDWNAEEQAAADEEAEQAGRDIATEDFLPHLLQGCGPVLQSLKLSGGGFTIDEEQMSQIAQGCTQLRSLFLQEVQIESVQPLAYARALRTLKLVECLDWEGEQEQYRKTLPSLPQLTSLALFDIIPLRRAEAEPLNAALLQRMPNLDAEDFFPKTFKD